MFAYLIAATFFDENYKKKIVKKLWISNTDFTILIYLYFLTTSQLYYFLKYLLVIQNF